jgi:NAD(P)-dependent dehydrogenase (short-subunit alcohol dehydrogenase family)
MKTIAVVTGGAGGIGLATAKLLGKEHHVVLCDVNPDKLHKAVNELRELDLSCESFICDVTDRDSVERLAGTAHRKGRVLALVHAAGVSPLMGDAAFVLRINALGTVLVNEAFLHRAEEGFASINVGSMAGYFLPRFLIPKRGYRFSRTDPDKLLRRLRSACRMVPGKYRSEMAYLISKNFVIWYSRTEAQRFGEKGARILSVSPGSIDTEIGQLEKESGSEQILKYAAIKRFGTPDEVAGVIAFSADKQAAYLTGVDIPCDGGVIAGFRTRDLLSFTARRTAR